MKIGKIMEPLFTARRVLIWLLLYPTADGVISNWTRLGRRLLPQFTFVLFLGSIISSLCFIMEFGSTNVEATLLTSAALVVYAGLLYIIAVAFFSRSRIVAFLRQLSKIFDISKYLSNLSNNHK